mmetsp:Transcript_22803/g.57609  ORF Transcript_22803/g.57609 Transcript_22803/m.57609 type:complete len:217 (-) Transcript_22803:2-652(-)
MLSVLWMLEPTASMANDSDWASAACPATQPASRQTSMSSNGLASFTSLGAATRRWAKYFCNPRWKDSRFFAVAAQKRAAATSGSSFTTRAKRRMRGLPSVSWSGTGVMLRGRPNSINISSPNPASKPPIRPDFDTSSCTTMETSMATMNFMLSSGVAISWLALLESMGNPCTAKLPQAKDFTPKATDGLLGLPTLLGRLSTKDVLASLGGFLPEQP